MTREIKLNFRTCEVSNVAVEYLDSEHVDNFALVLSTQLHVCNANYLTAHVNGLIKVYYYQNTAGQASIDETAVRPRSCKTVPFTLNISAPSNEYKQLMADQYKVFPKQIIFFLGGFVNSWTRVSPHKSTALDTYFVVNSTDGGIAQHCEVSRR
ncbi:hypothetical protein CYMTET_10371 [Cymbomonas tetramitiformis]|uniref:Uncharacterized protein n=1 Tax=Cymbomonas tetramitiformis TaxID=36881 RepID=A0AAE0GPM1_9CHLO|nr:hypothetical protein CYMTET_10371 [Cymbomonas tetramitiformis]